jgi:type VI secretion system protein ImpJ
MTISKELHWHEGLFLCPHHLQQFQRELSKDFVDLFRTIYSFPYGMIEVEIDKKKIKEEIVQFKKLVVLMPSGNIIDIAQNSYLPPFSTKGLIKPEDKSVMLYLALPFRNINKANLSSREELKNDKIARIYSVTEEEHNDENTGLNPKNISFRRLNPRIFSEYDNISDFETIPILKLKKNYTGALSIDNEYSPPCFKISGGHLLKVLAKKITVFVVKHRDEYRTTLQKYYEFKNAQYKILLPIMKLKILSSYAEELREVITRTDPTPFSVYLKFRKLIAEMSSIIPDETFHDVVEYNHDNPASSFLDIYDKLQTMFKYNFITKNYDKITFKQNADNYLEVDIPENDLKDKYNYYLSIKTTLPSEYLIKSVEDGTSFKCLPSSMVQMRAVPGFKLIFVSSLPDEIFREFNEYFFSIKKLNSSHWEELKKVQKMAVTERLDKDEGPIDQVNLVVLYGGDDA